MKVVQETRTTSTLSSAGDKTYTLEYGLGGDIQFDPKNIEEVRSQFAVKM